MARNVDLTQGKPLKLIFLYTIPVFLGSIFQQFYSMVDTAVVGRFVSIDALAAVGASGSLMFFILGFVFGLTSGFSVLVAQRVGAKDEEGLRKVLANTILLCIMITVLFTGLSIALVRPLLHLISTPENIFEQTLLYIVIIFAGTPFSMLYNMVASTLRAMGDSKTPLYFLILSSFLNIVLDLVLILVFKMGVAGAALATILSQAIAGFASLRYALNHYEVMRLKRSELRADWPLIWTMLKLGIPMALQSSITAFGMMVMQGALNALGSLSIAAYTAATKVEQLVCMFTGSLSVTMATYAGQNLGAKDIGRIRRGTRDGLILGFLSAGVSSVLCLFAGRFAMGLFVDMNAPQAVEMLDTGMIYLRIYAIFTIPFNILFLFRSILQGIGKSIYTLLGGIMEMVMRVLVSYTLPALIGFMGICLAGPAAWVGADIPLVIAFIYEMHKLNKQYKVVPPALKEQNLPSE